MLQMLVKEQVNGNTSKFDTNLILKFYIHFWTTSLLSSTLNGYLNSNRSPLDPDDTKMTLRGADFEVIFQVAFAK